MHKIYLFCIWRSVSQRKSQQITEVEKELNRTLVTFPDLKFSTRNGLKKKGQNYRQHFKESRNSNFINRIRIKVITMVGSCKKNVENKGTEMKISTKI